MPADHIGRFDGADGYRRCDGSAVVAVLAEIMTLPDLDVRMVVHIRVSGSTERTCRGRADVVSRAMRCPRQRAERLPLAAPFPWSPCATPTTGRGPPVGWAVHRVASQPVIVNAVEKRNTSRKPASVSSARSRSSVAVVVLARMRVNTTARCSAAMPRAAA